MSLSSTNIHNLETHILILIPYNLRAFPGCLGWELGFETSVQFLDRAAYSFNAEEEPKDAGYEVDRDPDEVVLCLIVSGSQK